MNAITHREFFGERERDFALTLSMIVELERLTGTGIGALFGKLIRREFSIGDLHQIIRLGLIGGGTDPKEAADLLAAYVYPRPIEEAALLAINVVSAAYLGTQPATDEDAAS